MDRLDIDLLHLVAEIFLARQGQHLGGQRLIRIGAGNNLPDRGDIGVWRGGGVPALDRLDHVEQQGDGELLSRLPPVEGVAVVCHQEGLPFPVERRIDDHRSGKSAQQ